MKKIKLIIKKLITKIKKILAGGEEPIPTTIPQEVLIIRTYKNGEKVGYLKLNKNEIIKEFCDLIQCFSKWEDYKILYDFPRKKIEIYFNVKKSADFEDIKNKEDKKK